MGWAELAAAAGVALRPSGAESARFGLEVARLTVGEGWTAADVRQALAGTAADLVVVRYDSSRADVPAALADPAWQVLPAGPIVYWRLAVGSGRPPPSVPGLVVRPTEDVAETAGAAADGDLVERVVTASFAGYVSHYSVNPLLDPEAALAGYVEWARTTVGDDRGEALVLLQERAPVGLATLASAATPVPHLEILLAGLVPEVQRRGWYAHLLAGVEAAAADRGLDEVVISTQVHNTGVQRAWARHGFEPFAAFETAHLVRAGSAAGRTLLAPSG